MNTPSPTTPSDKPRTPAGPRRIPAPRVLPESLPFWQAAEEGRLMFKQCRACGRPHHYPRDVCPFCLSTDTVWLQSGGLGSLYSYSTMGKGEEAYTLAYVTLDDGITLMTNIVDCDPRALRIGQRVRLVFKPSDGGHSVPMFTPA